VEASVQVLQDHEQGPEKPPQGLGGFVAELRRRHVVKVALAYAAMAFAALQAVQIFQAAWPFADWIFRLIVVFTLLGFPLVLVLAWVYEITPQGVRSMRVLDAQRGVRTTGRLPRLALLAVTALVVGASGWWWVKSTVGGQGWVGGFRGASADAGDGIRSLAVLPFDSYSDQNEGDFFAQGMHEALLSQLSQLDFLRVISRTSAEQYDKTGKSVPQIGADLGVDALVEGSVLRAEGKVRITVQLIEAATDRHLWAADYERDLVDIIALQREVAQAIVQEIRGELQPDAAATVMSAAPVSTDTVAMDEVMRGRQILAAASGPNISPSVLDSAAAHFQRAIGEDPEYATAHSGMAQVHVLRGLMGSMPSAEEIRAAVQSAQRAFSLAPEDREVREVMASVEMLGDMPPGPSDATALLPPTPPPPPSEPAAPRGRSQAESPAPSPARGRAGGDSIRRVIIRGQDSPLMTRTESGRQIQIAMAQREARSGEPTSLFRAAQRLSTLDLYDEAADLLEDVLEEQPRNLMAWDELERIRRVQGDVGEVMDLWRDRLQGRSSSSCREAPSLQDLERAVQRDGAQGYWQWRLDELESRRECGSQAPNLELAIVHAGLGHEDQALDFLERAARGGDQRLRSVRTDPVWDPYRTDPRFIRILSEADEVRPPQAGQNRGGPPGVGNQGQGGNQGRRGNQGGNQGGRTQGPAPQRTDTTQVG
jgi:TolB-like protein